AALEESEPDEIYNLAASSFVPDSAGEAADAVTAQAPARILEAIRTVQPKIRFFQAGSSEMFGDAATAPQDESTPFAPLTPYGRAKLPAYHSTVAARENNGLFAVCGILYNHESPRRPPHFVTRKITIAAAQIAAGSAAEVRLGDLDSRRDWGFAADT